MSNTFDIELRIYFLLVLNKFHLYNLTCYKKNPPTVHPVKGCYHYFLFVYYILYLRN